MVAPAANAPWSCCGTPVPLDPDAPPLLEPAEFELPLEPLLLAALPGEPLPPLEAVVVVLPDEPLPAPELLAATVPLDPPVLPVPLEALAPVLPTVAGVPELAPVEEPDVVPLDPDVTVLEPLALTEPVEAPADPMAEPVDPTPLALVAIEPDDPVLGEPVDELECPVLPLAVPVVLAAGPVVDPELPDADLLAAGVPHAASNSANSTTRFRRLSTMWRLPNPSAQLRRER
jgi:hypothetical protein